ncbi:cystatin-B-like [Pleuronectes platessa]|uniref:cystatin-B-like n=1 Tax=Pleuronectes platessa TaxID=8262 RepID=UPI00232A66F4|nr:cystatin-B-like [Pleuronectes platessa]
MSCGGYSEVVKADGEIQKICDAMKHEAEAKTGKNYIVFTAKLYRKQVVAGTNYLIKVHVGEEEYDHLIVCQKLPYNGGTLQLTGIQENKRLDDPLVPF